MRKPFLFLWIGIVVLLLFFWIYFPTLSHYRDLKLEEDRMTRELGELETKIEDLREERDLLENDQVYIEKVIREELGLVRPGEIVYKFVPEEAKKEETGQLSTPSQTLPPAQSR
jgi:cell division protein FtsB